MMNPTHVPLVEANKIGERGRGTIYRVIVTHEEQTIFKQALNVEASSAEEAEAVAKATYDEWANGQNTAAVRVIEPEQLVDADYIEVRYEVRPLNPERDRCEPVFPDSMDIQLAPGRYRVPVGRRNWELIVVNRTEMREP